ncbi:hypothetical protein ACU686_34560 [Yinghuangia aomiensis]
MGLGTARSAEGIAAAPTRGEAARWQTRQLPAYAHASASWRKVWRTTFPGRCVGRALDIQITDRMMALAAQAFLALMPLVIVLASAAPTAVGDGMLDWMRSRLGLRGETRTNVQDLTAATSEAGLTVVGCLLVLLSATSFSRALQRVYERAWVLTPGRAAQCAAAAGVDRGDRRLLRRHRAHREGDARRCGAGRAADAAGGGRVGGAVVVDAVRPAVRPGAVAAAAADGGVHDDRDGRVRAGVRAVCAAPCWQRTSAATARSALPSRSSRGWSRCSRW